MCGWFYSVNSFGVVSSSCVDFADSLA